MVSKVVTFRDCGGPYDLSPEHSTSSWESKETTCAEQAVIRYLVEEPSRYREKTLLHVGIGNGGLFEAIGRELKAYTGITISRPELDCFRRQFPDSKNARTALVNKHDERFFGSMGGDFDIIVDVNLKSFACCEKHFRATMSYFARALTCGGKLVTAQSGLDFGWAGNTAVAYTPGADTRPFMSHHRALRIEGLRRLAADLNLKADSVPLEPCGSCDAETIWILEKA